MKIIISKDEISIDIDNVLEQHEGQPITNSIVKVDNSVNKLVKTCIDGFIKIKELNHDEVEAKPNPFLNHIEDNASPIPLVETPTYEVIRERLPNSIDELDKTQVDLSKVKTEQLPIRQYKNFICPKCGQGSVIKTLGELQTYCFREVNKGKTSLFSLNKDHVENLIKKHDENKIEMPFIKYLIESTKPGDENYSEHVIEEIDLAITTDGNLNCMCPCCKNEDNFSLWHDAYKNTNKYFEYEPCIICGEETLTVVQKDNTLIQCENDKCKFTIKVERTDLDD